MNVFTPTDEAFSKMRSGTVEALLENMRDLIKVLISCPFDYYNPNGSRAQSKLWGGKRT
ncbi:hypothetical protein QT970_20040 [Microcoleus sp. herbarium8]|uniref:hypothetical protein n=1 Tax=Microcoleus sp. herbarium8 TaxID=3055436 RepID=UPI002FCFD268